MKFEDISLLCALSVAFYIFPAIYLTVHRVMEIMEHSTGISHSAEEPHRQRRWWIRDPCACCIVGFALSLSLFLFYLVFFVPLLLYGLCRPYCALACLGGYGNRDKDGKFWGKGAWRERVYWICWGGEGSHCIMDDVQGQGRMTERSHMVVEKTRGGKAHLGHRRMSMALARNAARYGKAGTWPRVGPRRSRLGEGGDLGGVLAGMAEGADDGDGDGDF
ncbi:hypothetical protein F4777DRAFT_594807 [Nemania sp. FL0916]|nr:hypothetical protein F4777DRAFT_594807 [Nemania sp. FL0916]